MEIPCRTKRVFEPLLRRCGIEPTNSWSNWITERLAMVDTTTRRFDSLMSLFGEEPRFDSILNVTEQDTAAYFLTDNLGYRYVLAHLSSEDNSLDNSLSIQHAAGPLPRSSWIPVQEGRVGTRWHRIPSVPRPTEQSIVEGSNCRTVWFHSLEPNLQENRDAWPFTQQTNEATSSTLDDALTDVDTSEEIWTDLLRNLVGWEAAVPDDRGQEQLAATLRADL